MADIFRANVSVTPIVTLAADADSNTEDVIHHDVKQRLGSNLSAYAKDASNTARWYYSAATVAVFTAGDLIAGFDGSGYLTGSTTTYTDGTSYSLLDDIMAVYIEHLGVDENDNTVETSLYISVDGGTTPDGDPNVMMLDSGESTILKFRKDGAVGQDIQYLHIMCRYDGETVKVKVLALIDDIVG